jgi:phage shock protein A
LLKKLGTISAHFSATHRQHKQMQGESAATSGYHSANAAVEQTEEKMAEATIGAQSNPATATAADRGVVATLTAANARLVKQLEDNSNELRELKALIKKVRTEKTSSTQFQHINKQLFLDSRLQS